MQSLSVLHAGPRLPGTHFLGGPGPGAGGFGFLPQPGPGALGGGPLPHLAAKSAAAARCHVPEASAQAVSSTCAWFASVAKLDSVSRGFEVGRYGFEVAAARDRGVHDLEWRPGEGAHLREEVLGVLDAGTQSVFAPLVLLEEDVVIARDVLGRLGRAHRGRDALGGAEWANLGPNAVDHRRRVFIFTWAPSPTA